MKDDKKKKIEFLVNLETFTTEERELTARQIIQMAGFDPDTYFLSEVQGDHTVSYKDKLDEQIRIHEHEKFVTTYMGPTEVS